jgi:hypothetical protein
MFFGKCYLHYKLTTWAQQPLNNFHFHNHGTQNTGDLSVGVNSPFLGNNLSELELET